MTAIADYTFMAPDGGVNYAINAELTGDKNGDGISDFYICYFKYAPTAQDVGASYSEDWTAALVMGRAGNLDAIDSADGARDGIINLDTALGAAFVPTADTVNPVELTITLPGSSTRDVFDANTVDENGNSVEDSRQVIITGGGRDTFFLREVTLTTTMAAPAKISCLIRTAKPALPLMHKTAATAQASPRATP
jgi:hypothetical protein